MLAVTSCIARESQAMGQKIVHRQSQGRGIHQSLYRRGNRIRTKVLLLSEQYRKLTYLPGALIDYGANNKFIAIVLLNKTNKNTFCYKIKKRKLDPILGDFLCKCVTYTSNHIHQS